MAALEKFSHVASTTVSSGGTTAPAAGTVETWTVASSSSFPSAQTRVHKFKVVDPAATSEVILVTNVTGTTWTVFRGADGTTPVAHSAGFTVRNVVTAASIATVIAESVSSFNVLDPQYGAKGDDSNADHVGIQAAMDAAFLNGGGRVYVPAGRYRIMQAPLRIRDNIRLVLDQDAVILRYNDFSSLVWNGDGSQLRAGYTGHGNILIEGGTWDMRCTTVTTAVASDNFTRANTSAPHSLGTSSGGASWIIEQGEIGINTNLAYAPAAGANISTLWGFSDGTVQATMSTAGNAGLIFRLANSQNYWFYRRGTSGNAEMGKVVNGTETIFPPDATVAVGAAAVLKVVMYGSTIKAYVSGTITHTDVDTDLQPERKVGVQILDTTARLSAFAHTSYIWQDTFTRANSAVSLGTSSSGQAWTAGGGTLGINTNQAYAPGAGNNIATLPATSETTVAVTMPTVGNAGVVFRYKDVNNYWFYRRDGSGNAELGKVVGGSITLMTADTPTAVAAGNTLKVVMLGWQIRAYVGTTKTHDDTDSAHYQETNVGIQILDTAARLSTFDSYASSGTDMSGACFNFGHAEGVTFRDLTVRDGSLNSHAVEIAGCKNVLFDNMVLAGAAFVTGRDESEALQFDMTKGTAYFAAFGPHDHTTCKDVTVRNCSFVPSGSAGTVKWGRGVGSHSATIGVWHDNIRVQGNYFEVSYRAVRGYNWNNCVVSSNNVASGSGIEVRPPWTGATNDTLNLQGVQTSASQNIENVVVADNTILCDAPAAPTAYAIRVFGDDTGQTIGSPGRITGATVTGNVVRSSTSGGIRLECVDRGIVANNTVNDTVNHAMGFSYCSDSLAIGNNITLAGQHGFYVLSGARNRLFQNYIKGASRTSNLGFSCIKLDTTPDEVTLGGNTTRRWGSGNEPAHGLHQSSGTNTMLLDNDFVNGGATSDVNMLAAAEIGRSIYREAAATTAIGTTITAITGLTMTLPTGRWRFTAWVPIVSVGTPTDLTVTVSPTGAPTATNIVYSVEVIGVASDGDYRTDIKTAFNSITGAGLVSNPTLVRIEGSCVVTTAGTLSVSMTRTGGTSATVQIGAYLQADRK